MAYVKKKTPRNNGAGYTKTGTNKTTGKKTTSSGTLTSVNKSEYEGGAKMKKAATPLATGRKIKRPR